MENGPQFLPLCLPMQDCALLSQGGNQAGKLKPTARASNPGRTLEGMWTPRRLAAVKEAAVSHGHP